MNMRHVLAILFALLPGPALAVQPDEILKDPALEARARSISSELRCLVCQNQSIDDSDAALARDLRLIVRERLSAGDSDLQVRDYLVQRYGDFILLKPPFKTETLVLWLAPAFVLGGGMAALLFFARRRRAPASPAGLSAAERDRLSALLDDRADRGQ
jgi:cytochrome c-type biogenesis protein CcmH